MKKDLKNQIALEEEEHPGKRRKTGGQGIAIAVLVLVMSFSAISFAGPALGIDTDSVGSEIGGIGESMGIGGIGEYTVTWWQVALIAVLLTIVTCYLLRYKFEDEGTETQEKTEEPVQESARRVSVGG